MQPTQQVEQFFRTLLTDPYAAENLMTAYSEHEQKALVFTATQNALFATFNSKPKPAQIRSIASQMRKFFNEPIDSYVLSTLIDIAFNPDDTSIQRRSDAIDPSAKQRMALLLPYTIRAIANPPDSGITQLAQISAKYYTSAMQVILDELGPNMGGFYRIVCTDPMSAATNLKADTTTTTEEKFTMVVIAAHLALHDLFPAGPTPNKRERLLHHLNTHHGDLEETAFNDLLDHSFNPDTTSIEFNASIYAIGMLIPSAVAELTHMTGAQIGDFARRCRAFHHDHRKATQ